MNRSNRLILTFVALAVVFLGLYLGLPQPLVIVLAVGIMFGGIIFMNRRQQAQWQTPALSADPALVARVQAACARAGRPDAAIAITPAGGRAMIRQKGAQLLVSPRLAELVNDEELDAMVLAEFTAPANLRLLQWLQILWVPALLLVVLGVLSLATGRNLWALILPLTLVWLVFADALGWLTRRPVRAVVEAFLRAGGDPTAYLWALMRLYAGVLRMAAPAERARAAGRVRSHLRQVAALTGATPDRLAAMAAAVDAPPELFRPELVPLGQRLAPYRQLLFIGFLVVLMAVSVILALALSQ